MAYYVHGQWEQQSIPGTEHQYQWLALRSLLQERRAALPPLSSCLGAGLWDLSCFSIYGYRSHQTLCTLLPCPVYDWGTDWNHVLLHTQTLGIEDPRDPPSPLLSCVLQGGEAAKLIQNRGADNLRMALWDQAFNPTSLPHIEIIGNTKNKVKTGTHSFMDQKWVRNTKGSLGPETQATAS